MALYGGIPQPDALPERPEPPYDPGTTVGEATEVDQLLSDKTLRWRCEQLLGAGMTQPQARALTFNRAVDVRAVIGWIERGCDPSTAFDIAS